MGSGKSTIGPVLAKKLGYRFVDIDREIENEHAMTISEVFAQRGELYFREKEAEKIAELARAKHAVIATGGGAMIEEINVKNAKAGGVIVYLKLPFDILYNRIKNDSGRPLVAANTPEKLEEIYNRRAPVYSACADLVIDADFSVSDIVKNITDLL